MTHTMVFCTSAASNLSHCDWVISHIPPGIPNIIVNFVTFHLNTTDSPDPNFSYNLILTDDASRNISRPPITGTIPGIEWNAAVLRLPIHLMRQSYPPRYPVQRNPALSFGAMRDYGRERAVGNKHPNPGMHPRVQPPGQCRLGDSFANEI